MTGLAAAAAAPAEFAGRDGDLLEVTLVLAVQPGDHIGAAFASLPEFARRSAAFAEQGLAASALVMVFPGDPYRDGLTAFRRILAGHSPAVAAALADGRAVLADSRRIQWAPGRFDPGHLRATYAAAARQAVTGGFTGLWVSVDMSWAREADPRELVRFEAEAAGLFAGRELTALCHYDRRVFPAPRVRAACRAHPAGPESTSPLRHRREHDGRTLCVSGEADMANAAAFAALTRLLRPGDTLDITGMTFLDVSALAVVARTRAAGLAVRVDPAQRHLLRLLTAGS